jgi:hypothetical protein
VAFNRQAGERPGEHHRGGDGHGGSQRVGEPVPEDLGAQFLDALRPTMAVSAAVMLAGALACLAVKRHRGPAANAHGQPEPEPEIAGAAGHG